MSASSEADRLAPTRRSLLSRLRNWSDTQSWQEFFDTYWKLIYSVARRAGLSPQEAEDVVQETLKAVAEKIQDFKYDPAKCRFKSWLHLLTRRRIADQFRKRPPGREQIGSVAPEPVDKSALESIWDEEFEHRLSEAALQRAKQKFQPAHFQIFELCVLRATPVKRVVDLMNVNIGQVYLAKHRVSRFLQAEIKRLREGLI